MIKLKGIGVSHGISIGKTYIVINRKIDLKKTSIESHEIENEIIRFNESTAKVMAELDLLIDNSALTDDDKNILTTHKFIIDDPEFENNINNLIKNELFSLEQAITKHFADTIKFFKNIDNQFYSQRAIDFKDVSERLLHNLLGLKNNFIDKLTPETILIMEEIQPSVILNIAQKKIRGLITENGSYTSHSSIIARSINLPTVVGVKGIIKLIENNQKIILDGDKGDIIISPDEETETIYQNMFKLQVLENEKLEKLIGITTQTKDGYRIDLLNNIEFPAEIESILKYKNDGVGLFRTEFLFLDRSDLPSEDEQFKIYLELAEKIFPQKMIIRTFDIGGDKLTQNVLFEEEKNPNLGCRGIRLSLKHIEVFKTQIKAILRATVKGNIKVMFPMISSVSELRKLKKIVKDCIVELEDKKINFDKNLKIGVMIEIPSAAILSDKIAAECDFFSVGTNDLTQYTLAVDRNSENISEYFNTFHPAVLKLIEMTVISAKNKNIPVSVCGEFASIQDAIPLLIGMGVDSLSISPSYSLQTKKIILSIEKDKSKKLVEEILELSTASEVQEKIHKWRKENEV